MDDAKIVTLRHPIAFGSETVSELRFRRGRLGDLKGIALPSDAAAVRMDDLILLAGRLCGQPPALIERLDEDDSGEVLALALGFIGRSLSTGPTP